MKLENTGIAAIFLLSLTACNGNSNDSARGGSTSSTTQPTLGAGVPGGTTTAGAPGVVSSFFIDPQSPDFIESDISHFRAALRGAWSSTACKTITEAGETSSSRAIYVFTDNELVESEYMYPSADCSGIPSSDWYPLPIRSWQLGEYQALGDGSMSWEFDTAITQRGVYAGLVSHDKGTNSYVNIGFSGGQLEFGELVAGYKPDRPTSRSGRYFTRMVEDAQQTTTQDKLLGTWFSACSGRLESTYEFNADTLVVTDENWADTGCEGASYASRRTTFSILYDAEFTSMFEDNMLGIEINAISNELTHFDAAQELDKPEFKVPEGKTEYRAVAILGDTLVLGYCLHRNSGDDDCQDSQNRQPDMVDYNWAVRFIKQNR